MANLKPLHDKLVIKKIEQEEKTVSGIYLTSDAQEKPDIGEVIAVGAGRKSDNGSVIEMSVKVGDKVAYQKYGPTELKIDGEEYLIVSESDILCVIS